jgi:hypothetical protein
MKKELDEKLCKSFPLLYAERYADPTQTAMSFGFQCSDGWYNLLYDLSYKLEELIKQETDTMCVCWDKKELHGADGKCMAQHTYRSVSSDCGCIGYEPLRPCASTVKEKFGGLRVYMNMSTDEMEKLISEAENLSMVTCELCGSPGELQTVRHWMMVRCNDCLEKEKNRKFGV